MESWGNYSSEIKQKLDEFTRQAEFVPGVIIIHEIPDFKVVYMTARGLDQLGTTLPELRQLKAEYHNRYFNVEDMNDFMPKLFKLIGEKDAKANICYFQEVKFAADNKWMWHITSTRIFAFDEHNNPFMIISIAIPVQDMKHIPQKAERLQQENFFLKRNIQRFLKLGTREKEVLKWVSLSFSSAEIAEKMFISVETVQTHRKNIKKKLDINTVYEFMEYARAFDLI